MPAIEPSRACGVQKRNICVQCPSQPQARLQTVPAIGGSAAALLL